MACCRESREAKTRPELAARWQILAVASLILFGSYYVYDIPAATEPELASFWNDAAAASGNNSDATCAAGNEFSTNFNLLYSLYSWPNIFLPFLGGVLSDMLGVRLMAVVFTALILVGQIITSLGASIADEALAWKVMWVGRTVFGFGGESLSVAQSALVAQWFAGKELAFALGVTLAVARLGSVLNDVVSAQIATQAPVYYAFWAGTLFCLLSLLAMIVGYYIDLRAENRLRRTAGYRPLRGHGLCERLFCCGRPCCGAGGDDDALLADAGAEALGDAPPKEVIELSAVTRFGLPFWLITGSCVTTYIAVLVYNNNAAAFVAQKFLTSSPLCSVPVDQRGNLYVSANNIMLITYLVSGIVVPFMGGAIDRVGKRAAFIALSAALIAGTHAVLAFAPPSAAFAAPAALVLLGLSYSIYASALWPSIAMVIAPRYQATAYGVTTAVQNLGLAVGPLVVAQLAPAPSCPTFGACVAAWDSVEYFFIAVGGAGLLFALALNIADAASGGVLNRSAAAAKAAAEEEDAAADGHKRLADD